MTELTDLTRRVFRAGMAKQRYACMTCNRVLKTRSHLNLHPDHDLRFWRQVSEEEASKLTGIKF